MSIERFQTNDRMSQMVIHGDTVYLAGQVAQSAPGASVAEQTRAILAQIDTLLAEAGTDKSKALSATIWLCSMDDFAEMNSVWDAWATGGNEISNTSAQKIYTSFSVPGSSSTGQSPQSAWCSIPSSARKPAGRATTTAETS